MTEWDLAYMRREVKPQPEPVAWVAVADKMPPEDVPCWLYEPGIGAWIGGWSGDADGWLWHHCHGSQYMDADGEWQANDAEAEDYSPTHWMALPAAPGAAPPAAPAVPMPEPIGYVSKTGHGTYFRETITPELAALEQGGRKMWTPVVAAPPAAPAVPLPEQGNDCSQCRTQQACRTEQMCLSTLYRGQFPPAAPAVPLTQLWCPETGELCSKCAKTGTCEASMLQAHGIGGGNG